MRQVRAIATADALRRGLRSQSRTLRWRPAIFRSSSATTVRRNGHSRACRCTSSREMQKRAMPMATIRVAYGTYFAASRRSRRRHPRYLIPATARATTTTDESARPQVAGLAKRRRPRTLRELADDTGNVVAFDHRDLRGLQRGAAAVLRAADARSDA